MPKVLLIEDDESVQALYKRVFSLEGFEIEIADGGQAGLDRVEAYHPDIVLLDMMMPSMNGLEVLSKLKASPSTNQIPVIALTNISEMRISEEAISRGAAMYLIKSDTEPDKAVSIVRDLLSKYGSNATTNPSEAPDPTEPS